MSESLDEVFDATCEAVYKQARQQLGDDAPEPRASLTLEFWSFLAPILIAKNFGIHFARGFNHALAAKEFMDWACDKKTRKKGRSAALVADYLRRVHERREKEKEMRRDKQRRRR